MKCDIKKCEKDAILYRIFEIDPDKKYHLCKDHVNHEYFQDFVLRETLLAN